jgi:hypothetical protein
MEFWLNACDLSQRLALPAEGACSEASLALRFEVGTGKQACASDVQICAFMPAVLDALFALQQIRQAAVTKQ